MVSPKGAVFISLNIVRFLSIVGLLLVFASSILVMVDDIKAVNHFMAEGGNSALQSAAAAGNTTDAEFVDCDYIANSTVPNQPAGVFWAVLNRLLIIAQVIFLFLSECSWPMAFFNRFFPVLGDDFGVGALGIFQCLIGAAVLSHHVDDFALVSAFFLFSVGCVNMLLGLIFRDKARQKRSLRAEKKRRQEQTLPTSVKSDFTVNSPYNQPSVLSKTYFYSENPIARQPSNASFGPSDQANRAFGRQTEKSGYPRTLLLEKSTGPPTYKSSEGPSRPQSPEEGQGDEEPAPARF